MRGQSIREQVRRNAVALISLAVAITGLGYNTWRNEHTENNRNQRWASFEILLKLGDLQQITYHIYYDRDLDDKGNPRAGWADVITIGDLSIVLEQPLPELAAQLNEVWGENWRCIVERDTCEDSKRSLQAIENAISGVRAATLELLSSLD